jgi:hypothetical protein
MDAMALSSPRRSRCAQPALRERRARLLSCRAVAVGLAAAVLVGAGAAPAQGRAALWVPLPDSSAVGSATTPPSLLALRTAYRSDRSVPPALPAPRMRPGTAGQIASAAAYGLTYGIATKVGSRLGLRGDFKVVRLETAYLFDVVGHAYVVREAGTTLAAITRACGYPADVSRTAGVWWGAFGSEMYMEAINGFMPGVRFDPLDPVGNFIGAWLATSGRDLASRHAFLSRWTLEYGYRSWSRMLGPARDTASLGNVWHDYPNSRFGLCFGVGPLRRPWVSLVGSYEITSLKLADLKNRLGIGLELHPFEWAAPAIERLPGGATLLAVERWLDHHLLLPGLYFELAHLDLGPFSNREPFQE